MAAKNEACLVDKPVYEIKVSIGWLLVEDSDQVSEHGGCIWQCEKYNRIDIMKASFGNSIFFCLHAAAHQSLPLVISWARYVQLWTSYLFGPLWRAGLVHLRTFLGAYSWLLCLVHLWALSQGNCQLPWDYPLHLRCLIHPHSFLRFDGHLKICCEKLGLSLPHSRGPHLCKDDSFHLGLEHSHWV